LLSRHRKRDIVTAQVTRRDVRHIDGETISVVSSQVMTAAIVSSPDAPLATGSDAVIDPISLDPTTLGIEARAVEATLACIARHGLSKTTIDDIAREAGCSRATLYRYFANKTDLVARVVRTEAERITAVCRAVAADADTLDDAVVAVLLVGGRELTEHPALRFVADFEPEILLPHLTFAGGDRFLRDASEALAPCFEPYLGERAARAAEWIARIGLTLWLSPTAPVSLHDADALRAYADEFVVPAIRPASLDSISPDLDSSHIAHPTRG
jgi:AcrR family transcriptional regulator